MGGYTCKNCGTVYHGGTPSLVVVVGTQRIKLGPCCARPAMTEKVYTYAGKEKP